MICLLLGAGDGDGDGREEKRAKIADMMNRELTIMQFILWI